MQVWTGSVIEIRYTAQAGQSAWIECPSQAVPNPGQYVQAWAPGDQSTPLGSSIFPAQVAENGFLAAPPVPSSWNPGTLLEMHGPKGKGFRIPRTTQRLALATLDGTASRLMPLIPIALSNSTAIALFTDLHLPDIPAEVEIYPLHHLPELLNWPDLMILDLNLEALGLLRNQLGLAPHEELPCQAQALMITPMPCAGIASCGACAVPGPRRNWHTTCQDGPVFDLNELEW